MHGQTMHIACPNCHAIYDVPESKLESALSLRCHACRYSWPLDIAVKPRPRLPFSKEQRAEPVAPPSDSLSSPSPGTTAAPQATAKSAESPPDATSLSPAMEEGRSPPLSPPSASSSLPDQSGSITTAAPLKEGKQRSIFISEPPAATPLSAPTQEPDAVLADTATLNRPVKPETFPRSASLESQPDVKWPAFDPQATSPAAMYAESSLIPEQPADEDLDYPAHRDDVPEEALGRSDPQPHRRAQTLLWIGLPILIILALIVLCRGEIIQILPVSAGWFGRLGLS